jgi:hypothetical protein
MEWRKFMSWSGARRALLGGTAGVGAIAALPALSGWDAEANKARKKRRKQCKKQCKKVHKRCDRSCNELPEGDRELCQQDCKIAHKQCKKVC